MKKILLFVWAVFFLFNFSSCREKGPIKLGYLGILTGNHSGVGIASRNAITLAIEEVNEAGGINGRQLELIIRDDKGNPETSLIMAEELVDEGVVAIFGPTTSTVATSLQSHYNHEGPLFLSSTVSSTSLDGIDDNLFKLISVSNRQVKMTDLLIGHSEVMDVVFVNDLTNDGFAKNYIHEFEAEYEKRGGSILKVLEFTPQGNAAYYQVAEEVLDLNPQGVIFLGDNRNTALLCQQLYKLEYEGSLFTNAMTTQLIDQGGRSVEGLMMISTFDPNSNDPDFLEFSKNYEDRFSIEINFAVKRSYEAALILIDALKRDPSAKELKKTILSKGTYQGIQGDLIIDEYGDVERDMFMLIVEDGEMRTLEASL